MSATSKFKVGEQVVVTGNTTQHGFNLGEVVTITKVYNGYYRCESPSDYWFIRENNLELHQDNPWIECPLGYTEDDNHEVSYSMGVPTHYRESEPELETVERRVFFCENLYVHHLGSSENQNATIKGQTLGGNPVGQWVIDMDEN